MKLKLWRKFDNMTKTKTKIRDCFRRHFVATFRQSVVTYRENARVIASNSTFSNIVAILIPVSKCVINLSKSYLVWLHSFWCDTWVTNTHSLTDTLVDHRRWRYWQQQKTTLLSFFSTVPCLATSPSAECSYNHSTLLCRPSTVFWVFLGDVNHLHCPPRLSVPNFLHFPW